MLFGNNVDNVADMIASRNGIKKSSASSLLSIVAPILISILGKYVKSNGLGLSGLTSLLMGLKDSVQATLPAGLASTLNFSDLGYFKGAERPTVRHEIVEEERKSGMPGWLPWLIGALLIAALVWG